MNTKEAGLSGRNPEVYRRWAVALVSLLRKSATVPTDPDHVATVSILAALAHEARQATAPIKRKAL